MPKTNANRTRPHRDHQLSEMTPATKQLAVKLDRTLASAHCDALLLRYDTGRSLARVVAEEATYGSSAVEQLAAYLGMSPDRLYKLRTYALVFTRQQVTAYAKRSMANGGRIRYHHLAAIMVVRSPQERLRLVELVFTESLSVRSLRDRIAGGRDETHDDKRQSRQPKSLLRELVRLIERSQSMVKKFGLWEKDVFQRMEQPDAARFQPILRNKACMAHSVLEELAGSVDVALERLSGALRQTAQLSDGNRAA